MVGRMIRVVGGLMKVCQCLGWRCSRFVCRWLGARTVVRMTLDYVESSFGAVSLWLFARG